MAESADVNHNVSGDSNGRSSPEESSRADLEKQVKKYLNYLQKAKTKCDELSNKCTSLEKERDAANEVILKWRNESNTEYVEELRYEIKELKKKIQQFNGENNVPNEDFEVIKAARDTAIKAMKEMKHKLALSMTENQNNLFEIKRLNELEAEFRKQIHEKSVLEVNLREQLSVKENLEADLKQQLNANCALEADLREQLSVKDNLETDLKQQLNGKCALETDLKEQLSLKDNLETDLKQQLNEKCAVEADLREQLSIKDNLEADLKQQLNAKCALETNLREQLSEKDNLEADLKQQLNVKCADFREQLDAKFFLEVTLREELSAICAVEADLREQLTAKGNLEADLKEQLDAKDALETDLKQQLSTMNAIEADLIEQLNSKGSLGVSDLENANEKLTADYNELFQKCKDIQSECKMIKSQFEETLNEKNKLFEENSVLNEKFQASEVMLQEINIKLQQEKGNLENENLEMAKAIDLIKKNNETLTLRCTDLENKIKGHLNSFQVLNKSLEEAKMENLKFNEHIKNLNTELTSLNLKYTDLLNKNCLVSDVQSLLLKLSCFANQAESQSLDIIEISEFICTQFEELKIKLDTLENEKLHENESKENSSGRIQELDTKITELSLALKSYQEKNETLKEKLEKFKEMKELLESESKESVTRINQEFEIQIADLSSKLESSERENKNLKEKMELIEKEIEQENKYEKDTSKRIQGLESEISDLLSKLDSSEEENRSLEIKLELMQKELQENNEYKENASIKIQELETEISNFSLKFRSFEEENKNLKEKLEFEEKEKLQENENRENVSRSIQEFKLEISNLLLKLSHNEEENMNLKEKLESTEQERLHECEYKENVSRKIKELEAEIVELSLRLNSSQEENKTLKEKFEEFLEKEKLQSISEENTVKIIQEFKTEIAVLSSKLSLFEGENKGLREKLDFTEKKKLEKDEYEECIKKRIQELETEIDKLSFKFISSEEENKDLKEKFKEFTEIKSKSIDVLCQTHVQSQDVSTDIEKAVQDASFQTDFVESHSDETAQLVSPVVREVAFEISEWGFAGQDTFVNESVDGKLPEVGVSTQTCIDIYHASTNTDEVINEELQVLSREMMDKDIEIENLLKECENLKSQLDLKSRLVEEIHCRLDFLLTKEEELNSEIEAQNKVIRATNEQNHSLQIELDSLREQGTPLLHVRDALNEVKCMGNNIKVNVNTFTSDFMAVISSVNNDISSKCNNFYEHLEHNYTKKLSDTQEEIECYKVFLHDMSLEIKDMLRMFADFQLKGYLNNEIDHNVSEGFSISCSYEADQFNTFKSNFFLHCNKVKNNLHTTFDVVSQLAETYNEQVKELSDLKDCTVPSLQCRIQDLEHSLGNSIHVNAEADQKSNNDVEALRTQLLETETKMNKFKAIAIKWKKEFAECQKKYQESLSERDKYKEQVNEIASELDNISTTHSQYVLNFQNLQNENDKLQDVREEMKADMKNLQTTLSATEADLQKCNESLSLMESELQKSKQLLLVAEVQRTEMEGKKNDSESKIIILETKNSEDQSKIQDLVSELAIGQNEVAGLMKEKDLLKQKLEDALKEGKQHSLLDLEMADYERSIEELTNKLTKANAENDELQRDVENLKVKIDTLQAEIKICENHRDTEEKRADGFKEILENTKKELISIKEREAELQSNCAQLTIKVETLGQKGEDYKSQLSKQSAEIERLKEMLKSSAESHHKSVRCLESKIASQKQDILMAHKEVESVKQDFENYKIRVHSVLKQQQKNVPAFAPSQTSEKDNQDAQIEKLKLQIKDVSDKLYALTLERDSLQEKHDHLLQRYNKMVEEAELKDRNWGNRIEHVHMEKSKLQSLLQDMTSEHAVQSERISATYKKQIKILQEEHNNALKELQSQLVSADIEIAHLQREQQKYVNNSLTPSTQEEPFSFDMLSQERQEGEGSECTEDGNMNIKHLSLATIPTGGFMPLEKLLQSPVESETSTSVASILDPEKLNNDLSASWKKIDHLRELLNESEANNLRLGDQVRILKEEIRRLERNKQREEHAENLEYLKNVFIKFATLEPGSERAMLVPVLTTMLRLSPAEQKEMKLVAGDKNSSETATATWGSYLHRWSGT